MQFHCKKVQVLQAFSCVRVKLLWSLYFEATPQDENISTWLQPLGRVDLSRETAV
jgi:hypothetical protein